MPAAAGISAAAAIASSQKLLRHPSDAASAPAASGPIAMPAPTAAPQTLVASARRCPVGNACPIAPRDAARMPAPATPWRIRATISTFMLGATAPSVLVSASSALEMHQHAPAAEVVRQRADGEQRDGEPEAHPAERPRLARDVAVERAQAVADRRHDRAEHREDEQRRRGGDPQGAAGLGVFGAASWRELSGSAGRRRWSSILLVSSVIEPWVSAQPSTTSSMIEPVCARMAACSARTTSARTAGSPVRSR